MASDEQMAARAPPSTRDTTAAVPTAILAYILSFLPLRSALPCGGLSRSWRAAVREFLSRAADLELRLDFAAGLSPEQYCAAVGSVLAAHEAEVLDTLKIVFLSGCRMPSVESWLEFGASKGVRVLELDFARNDEPPPVPCQIRGSVFNSRSLSCLSLSFCRLSSPLNPVELPSLQMLSLLLVDITDDNVASLLRGCPAIAALKLMLCHKLSVLGISSPPRLHTLTIISCDRLGCLVIDLGVLPSLRCCN